MKTYKIATVSIPGVAFATESLAGLKKELAKHEHQYQVTYDSFYADNKLAMTAVINEVADREYDLIFSVGAMFSQTARNVCLKRKKNIPLVFAGVINPTELELVQSEEHPGEFVTGVTFDDVDPNIIMDALHHVKPSMKHVLLPWEPAGNGGRMQEAVDQATAALSKHGIKVTQVVVESVGEVIEKVAPFCPSVDTIIVLPGSAASEATDGLVKLANQHGVTLAAYALNSAERGAALAWGAFCYDIGVAGAHQVHDILHHGKNPGDMPVHRLTDWYRIAINAKAAGQQNLPLSQAQLFLLRNSMVI